MESIIKNLLAEKVPLRLAGFNGNSTKHLTHKGHTSDTNASREERERGVLPTSGYEAGVTLLLGHPDKGIKRKEKRIF